jgi:hypothetical protein
MISRAASRVVKQLPAEMLQQCSHASSYMWMHIVMEEHYSYTICQHFCFAFCSEWLYAVFLVFCNILLTLLWSLVVRIPPSALFSVPENSCHQLSGRQAGNVCLNFFALFGECVCVHCFDCSLVSTFANETQVSSPVTHMI